MLSLIIYYYSRAVILLKAPHFEYI